ncbi:hypothetical protein ACFYKX_17465 [Cytobacillus sp. FJAT-54145]|uniref:Type VII secretion protein EssA n=1 Tax=Cytobacillus spartinae TaxID=3299023 RepID=A0ABW6KDS9_9BACI
MMKKFMIFISALTIFAFLPGMASAEKMSSESRSKFAPAVEEHLRNTINYYNPNSAVTLDSLEMEVADIYKIVKPDDPKTPENDEVIEEYTSHLVTVLVDYEIKRDTLFIFKKKEVIYYDITNDEILNSGNVFVNDEVKEFFQLYLDDLDKNITPLSLTIFMIALSLLVVIPIFIMIFHNKGNSSNTIYHNNPSIRG